jgi:hypothetical protein
MKLEERLHVPHLILDEYVRSLHVILRGVAATALSGYIKQW